MGRMYSAAFKGVAVTVIQDLFELNAPSTAIVVLHEVKITTAATVSEVLRCSLNRASASGSAGTTPTAQLLELGSTAFGGTVEANNTTQGTPAANDLWSERWNVLNGFHYLPTPETRIVLSPSGRLVVILGVAPAASMNMTGSIVFEEIGT